MDHKFFRFYNAEPDAVNTSAPDTTEEGLEEQNTQPTAEDLERLQTAMKKRVAEQKEQAARAKAEAQALREKLAEIEAQERAAKEDQERKEQEALEKNLMEQRKFEQLLQEKEKAAAKAIAEKDARIRDLMEQLNQTSDLSRAALVQRDFDLEFVKLGGITDQADLLYPAYQKYFRYNYETRQTEVVNPGTGEVMTNDLGEPFGLTDFIEGVLKKERPSCFKSTRRSGIDTQPQPNEGGTSGKLNIPFEELLKMKGSARAQLWNR